MNARLRMIVSTLVLVGTVGAVAGLSSRAVLAQYDKDKNQKLSRSEIGLDQETFDKLDGNKDGRLSPEEMQSFMHGATGPGRPVAR